MNPISEYLGREDVYERHNSEAAYVAPTISQIQEHLLNCSQEVLNQAFQTFYIPLLLTFAIQVTSEFLWFKIKLNFDHENICFNSYFLIADLSFWSTWSISSHDGASLRASGSGYFSLLGSGVIFLGLLPTVGERGGGGAKVALRFWYGSNWYQFNISIKF